MNKKYRVLLADNQTLIREGVRKLLSFQDNLKIVGETGNGGEALRLADELQPDLILIISMPLVSWLEIILKIRSKWKDPKIVILTNNEKDEYILSALKAGVDGYILEDSTKDELLEAINLVLSGQRVLSPRINDKIVESYIKNSRSFAPWRTLTRRERDTLKLIGEGHRSKVIADFLGISPRTVEKHRSNIMKKLDLHSTPALVAFSIEKGFLPVASP